jgi:hypothetical protein
MLINCVESGVNLVTQMQHARDLQNVWIMFDHAKHVASWIIMACHVYDIVFCKMLTTIVCDM